MFCEKFGKTCKISYNYCQKCNKLFIVQKKRKQKFCTQLCARKALPHGFSKDINWSEVHKKAFANGRKHVTGGTTKWYEVETSNGLIKVQGSFEVKTALILDEWKESGKIFNWEYTNDRFPYQNADGNIRTYILDFKVWKDEFAFYYLEVKGYEQPNDKFKWNAIRNLGFELQIWFKNDIGV